MCVYMCVGGEDMCLWGGEDICGGVGTLYLPLLGGKN